MKKTLWIILAFALFLSGCGNSAKSSAVPSEYFVIDYNDRFQYENGELYVDTSQRLHFADFSSVTDAVICPKPNCPHTDESCSALGMDNHPVIVEGSIYWFEDNTRYEGDRPISGLNVYKAAIDGTGRVKTDTVDGVTLLSGAGSAFGSGVLYFGGINEHPEGKPFGVRELYLCGYDFAGKRLTVKELLCVGYSADVTFCGELGGELYFILNYQEENADWWDEDTDEARKHNGAELRRVSIAEYKKLDLETLEITDWELPEKIVSAHKKRESDPNASVLPIYVQIKEGAMICSDCVDTLIVNPSGREIFIKDYNGNDKAVANGYIFDDLSTGECSARRLSDGKEVTVNVAEENVRVGYVAKYLDGKYIIRYFDFDSQQTLYCAVSGDEFTVE